MSSDQNIEDLRKELQEAIGVELPPPKQTSYHFHHRTDLGNALRFAEQHKDAVRYCHALKSWFIWDGNRWRRDESQEILRLTQKTVQSIYSEAPLCDSEDDRKAIVKHAMRTESHNSLMAMLKLAQHQKGIPIQAETLDPPVDRLVVSNGVLDLNSLSLLEPDPSFFLTKGLSIPYDPTATCPVWERFISEIMGGDAELIQFLQKSLGYTLLPSSLEQCLFFLYGLGRNGKSTFVNAIFDIFGQCATKIPVNALMSSKYDSAQTEIARLPGIRLVVASESDTGHRFSENVLKDMTGGDVLTGRELYGKTFTFVPQFTLWLYGNHKPAIRGTDEGIWRRIKMIPFMQQFTGDRCDPGLASKLRAEYPGILSWIARGLTMYRKDGLKVPETVSAATNDYRGEMDALGMFLEDCCVVGDAYKCTVADMYRTYKSWAEHNGEYLLSHRRFGIELASRDFRRLKGTGGVRMWGGVGLTPSDFGFGGGGDEDSSSYRKWGL